MEPPAFAINKWNQAEDQASTISMKNSISPRRTRRSEF